MRLITWVMACVGVVAGAMSHRQLLSAQSAQGLTAKQNSAKAREVLQQTITALGGHAFLDVRDSDCSGRITEFGHGGEIVVYVPFQQLWLLPNKSRTEYNSRNQFLIEVFSGDEGWMLDRSGLSDQTEDAIQSFADDVQFGIFSVLRSGWNDENAPLHYAGALWSTRPKLSG